MVIVALASTLLMTSTVQAARYAGIVVDAKTGKVIYSSDPDGLRYPASLTKMMTLYLVFEALERGKISKNTIVTMSRYAASQSPSKLGVKAGGSFTVEQGILALVTRSANDCSVAFGELLGGSEARFARMMTAKAHALGMSRTVYRNANGLPNDGQVTTARDQARLGLALRQHFPQYYDYFSTRSFRFGKQVIGNHNKLLGRVRGVDGIKTGYIRKSGFNLVTSAQLDGKSIVGVVMGFPSGSSRDAHMASLVKKYLPKASTRGGFAAPVATKEQAAPLAVSQAKDAVPNAAKPASIAAMDDDSVLPKSGPVPSSRYTVEEIAAAISPKDPLPGEDAPVTIAMADKQTQSQDLDSEETTVASVRTPAAGPIPPEPVGKAGPNVDQQTTASTPAPKKVAVAEKASAEKDSGADNKTPNGWVIQIGVAADKDKAKKLLQAAQDKGGKVLRSASPYSVAFQSEGTRMYRARFSGFKNQEAALNACKLLKKKGTSCWASLQ
jgi:D-alanyl-D-alanine carboxypeptidase